MKIHDALGQGDPLPIRPGDAVRVKRPPARVLKSQPLTLIHNRRSKRIFDILFSSLVLVFVFPWLLPIIAVVIQIESFGPIFFVQERTGYLNKSFKCLKFRSMRVNRDKDKKQAVRGDERVTRVGMFLRKYNIDEMPQFINVLLGDMSVVGPRPHMLKHTEEYRHVINDYMMRHQALPGVTGWAQVNGFRGPTPTYDIMQARIDHDIWYIENWSMHLDLKCVWMTVANCLEGEENAI